MGKREEFAMSQNLYVIYVAFGVGTEIGMNKSNIDRINFLARKAASEGLTEAEKQEQQALRMQYVQNFRCNLQGILDNTNVKRPDGTVEKLNPKK